MNFLTTDNHSEPQILTGASKGSNLNVLAGSQLPDSGRGFADSISKFLNRNPLICHCLHDAGRIVKICISLRQVST